MSGTQTPPLPRRRGDELVAALAERIGARIGASTVYGAAIERDGVTAIPVAVARFGFGGWSGADPGKGQESDGGGGLGGVSPVGYIELKDGATRFVPVVRPATIAALMVGAGPAALALLRRPRTLA